MIVPGSPNALLLAQSGDPLEEGGVAERGLRLRRTATSYLSLTPPVPATVQKITFSFHIKRTDLGVYQALFGGGPVSSGLAGDYFGFDATDHFYTTYDDSVNGSPAVFATTRVFRDPAAHLHFVLGFDTTQVVQANRVTLEVNGEVVAISNSLVLNANLYFLWSAASKAAIGVRGGTVLIDLPAGAVLSQFSVVTGTKLSAKTFGQLNSRTGQWLPKSKASIRAAVAAAGGSVRNGWGANGFFLPFDDATSLTTLGYDRSQSDTDTSGNNWTATNISLTAGATYDSMLDIPMNNFCTWNPLDTAVTANGCTLAAGNLALVTGASSYNSGHGTFPMTTGKWYWEVTPTANTAASGVSIGIDFGNCVNSAGYPGSVNSPMSYAYFSQSGVKSNNGTPSAYGDSLSDNDVVGVAYDADAGKLYFSKNGVWQNSGDPAAGTGYAFSDLSGTAFPALGDASGNLSSTIQINFGQRPFAYPPPTGYKTLNTKNLKRPTIENSKSAFVVVADTGANIAATLAAARSGWSAYIDIIKRRDAAEGWRWIFFDDAANHLDSSSTAAKAAVPSFSGAAYVGYSLKVSAKNGVATGRLAHASGVADVVSDGLSNSRKMVILKNEASGTWYVYHPDLTSGKLLYFEQTAAETTDATVGSVTAQGFTVAATLASGTYRWVSIAEVDGFLKLFKYTGNASTGGPFSNCSHLPAFFMLKNKDAVQTWLEWDNVRDTKNPQVTQIYPNQTAGELIDSVNNLCDFVSQGIKYRGASSPGNGSGNTIVGMSLAAFPFRYANAR